MTFLGRLCGVDALQAQIEDLARALNDVVRRVEELEARVPAATLLGCREWEAWHDRMPGVQPTLHVRGWCTFPSDGYDVHLERHEPQGVNPRDLLLDLVVRKPKDPAAQVVTDEEVRYEEQTDSVYEAVTILPEGPTVKVAVVV
jgi:hypothetical protein